jgi:hypothetical protein
MELITTVELPCIVLITHTWLNAARYVQKARTFVNLTVDLGNIQPKIQLLSDCSRKKNNSKLPSPQTASKTIMALSAAIPGQKDELHAHVSTHT